MGIIMLTDFMGRVSNLSALKDFISFLATVKGDLSNITAPPFILAPQSLTEFPSYWAERPSLFSATASESSPERRMLYVLELYLTSLQRQYYIGQPVSAGTKKPLNPFLGELFFCEGHDSDTNSHVKVICEQVSHHPPTTAAFLEDSEHGVYAEAYSTQHTSLSGTSVVVRQTGHALLTIAAHNNETYLLPFPDVYAKNVLTGSPYPELSGTYKIFSSSGLTAEITFGGKSRNPFSSSEKNSFEASIYRTSNNGNNNSKDNKPIYTATGIWSSSWTVKDAHTQKDLYTTTLNSPQSNTHAQVPITVTPLSSQSPWESRRAWHDTATALQSGDFSTAVAAKSKLETAQREMRKQEKKEGREWESAFFVPVGQEEKVAEELKQVLEVAGKEVDLKSILGGGAEGGCWRFSREKERRWREKGGMVVEGWPKGPGNEQ